MATTKPLFGVGKTLQLQRGGVRSEVFECDLPNSKQRRWRSYQHRADAPDPVAGESRTAMRSGHEDHAPNIAPVIEDKNLLDQSFTLGIHRGLGRRTSERVDPESVPASVSKVLVMHPPTL
jgi:hypothetical protein